MLDWLVFAVIGKLLIFLWQKIPLPAGKIRVIEELHKCDLCSGVWIYSALALFFGIDIIGDIFGYAVPVVGELVTGAITSFVVHIFVLGWKARFEVVVI